MAEEENATLPMAEEENAATPMVEEANAAPSIVEEESTAPPIVEEENDGAPPMVEEENGVPPTAEEENGVPPTAVEENGVPPTAVEENGVPPTAEEEDEAAQPTPEEENGATIRPEFPTSRVKKIMKIDRDINKVNSEALFLVTYSAQLFTELLAEKSAEAALEKKRKIVKLEHIRTAVKRHRPTSDFLLDELPMPSQPSDHQATDRSRSRPVADNPAPAGTRRIDDFFRSKTASEPSIEVNES